MNALWKIEGENDWCRSIKLDDGGFGVEFHRNGHPYFASGDNVEQLALSLAETIRLIYGH